MILGITVHSAGDHDREGVKNLLLKTKAKYQSINRFFADGAYGGRLQNWCFLQAKALLSVVKRNTEKFTVLPIIWIVKRTFGWMNNFRRLSKHYEHTCKSAKAQIEIAMIRLMLKR